MCIIKGLPTCNCPVPPLPPEVFDPVKPRYRSPIDCLGYPNRCCRCFPLKAGVGIICFLSFMWALYELVKSERTIATLFTENDDVFKAAKMVHVFIITVYLLSCGVLLLGIITNSFKAINIYVWVALIFNCICIVVIFTSLTFQMTRGLAAKRRIAYLMVISILWHCLFFYYVSVVNSYKYHLLATSVFVT